LDVLQSIQQSIEQKIEGLTQQKNWQWKAAFIVSFFSVISIFTNVVPLEHYVQYGKALLGHHEYFSYDTVVDRAKDLTGNHTYPPLTGLNNRTFRLTMPVFVRIFHLYPATFWLYVIQLLLGIVFFKLLIEKFTEVFKDFVSTIYATIAVATTYTGMSFWVDFSGYGDFFSYFFLFLTIYYRSPFLILVASQLAFWNDERAFVAAIFPFLWWWFDFSKSNEKRISWIPNKQMTSIILSWILYWVIRYFILEKFLGMQHTYDNSEFAINLPQNLKVFGFKIGWGLEGLWLIVLFAFMVLWKTNDRLRLFFMASALVAFSLLAMTIYDTTRSSAFAYIIVFPCLVVLAENTEKQRLRAILLLIALLCFLHPLATKTNAIGFFLM
jgi:hypothetical protein